MAEENQDQNSDGIEEPIEEAVEQPEVTDEAEVEEPKEKKLSHKHIRRCRRIERCRSRWSPYH